MADFDSYQMCNGPLGDKLQPKFKSAVTEKKLLIGTKEFLNILFSSGPLGYTHL